MSHWETGVGFFSLFPGSGKRIGSLASDLLPRLATSISLFIHIRCDISRRFPCFVTFLRFCFTRGRDGYHVFQGSRGGNDTRLHCLGTIAISGFVFLFFFCWFVAPGFQFSSILHLTLSGLYIGFLLGMGDTRILITSLPRGAVAGWGVWLRSETMGCGVVFCF